MADSPLTFETFQDRFIAFYQQGAYSQALHLIKTSGPQFPENSAQIMAWQCAMLSRLKRVDEALKVLQLADAQGYWYDEQALLNDPDFEALQAHPDFTGLVKRMAARRQTAIPQLLPELLAIEPAGPGPHPLCLVLHGNFSNPESTLPSWQKLVEHGWILAALQSSQPGWASGIYVWNDIPRALADVKELHSDLLAHYEVDPQPVIAGGFSMGATIAVRMALDPDFHLRGVIAHEAWFSDEAMADLEQAANRASPTQTRVLLIAGQENAEYSAMAQQVHDLLSGRGFPCRVMHSSNPHHGYPPDFTRLLLQAIDWIMEDPKK